MPLNREVRKITGRARSERLAYPTNGNLVERGASFSREKYAVTAHVAANSLRNVELQPYMSEPAPIFPIEGCLAFNGSCRARVSPRRLA